MSHDHAMVAQARSFASPDEMLEVAGVHKDVVHIGGMPVVRAVYPTGWLHSRDVGPEPCGDTHVGYCVSGRLRVWWDDDRELLVEGGQVVVLPPGHDAECLEECTLIQFDGGDSAARRFGF
jgi:hypothetical protein